MVLHRIVPGHRSNADIRHVRATQDVETGHWWAESDDLPGLVSEAPTLEALMDRVTEVAPELLDLNGEVGKSVTIEFQALREVHLA